MAHVLARGSPRWLPLAVSLPLLYIPLHVYFGSSTALATLPILTLTAAILLFFFRDPERAIGEGVVSPADGRVMAIREERGRVHLSIYMGPLDVHVNRSPVDGRILSVKHLEGGHRLAFSKDSPLNERVVWTLDCTVGQVELVQIAGAFARRIIPYKDAGEVVQKGERIGLIRFGSRVDLSVPALPSLRLRVRVGDRVKAGTTTLMEVGGC